MEKKSFYDQLRPLLDEYAHEVYRVTKSFPREELFGVTSQLRRASLSVVLNYIEGYARQREKVFKNFVETAYGSLQESKYLLGFALKEGYFSQNDFLKLNSMAEKAGAMLWGTLQKM